MPKTAKSETKRLNLHPVPVDQEFLLVPENQISETVARNRATNLSEAIVPVMRFGTAYKFLRAAWSRKKVPDNMPF